MIFITGVTGYIGSYVVNELLTGYSDRLALLVRAGSVAEARRRLWKALQLQAVIRHHAKQARAWAGDTGVRIPVLTNAAHRLGV